LPSTGYCGSTNDSQQEPQAKPAYEHPETKKESLQDPLNLWLHAIGATVLIKGATFLIINLLKLLNLHNTVVLKPRLQVLAAFGSGSLLANSFLRLIPYSHPKEDNHERKEDSATQEDINIGFWVLSGVLTFFAVEKIVRMLRGGEGHSHGPVMQNDNVENNDPKDENIASYDSINKDNIPPTETGIALSGYLNFLADFTHNFTDGLGIGASYLAGNSIGIVTILTIFLHEIPHEIGDFAILINSGCSRCQALTLQLVTTLGVIIGTVVLLLCFSSEAIPWLLPFTAGGFIYIAAVSVLPSLLKDSTKFGQSLKEIIALVAGAGLIMLIGFILINNHV